MCARFEKQRNGRYRMAGSAIARAQDHSAKQRDRRECIAASEAKQNEKKKLKKKIEKTGREKLRKRF